MNRMFFIILVCLLLTSCSNNKDLMQDWVFEKQLTLEICKKHFGKPDNTKTEDSLIINTWNNIKIENITGELSLIERTNTSYLEWVTKESNEKNIKTIYDYLIKKYRLDKVLPENIYVFYYDVNDQFSYCIDFREDNGRLEVKWPYGSATTIKASGE